MQQSRLNTWLNFQSALPPKVAHFSVGANKVMPETIYEAFAQGIGKQTRKLWTQNSEIVITADANHLQQAILERQHETLRRLLGSRA
jgi:hypothetical protein